MMSYSTNELLALALAVSFAAGLNVYAVIATLGLLAQADVVSLPPGIAVLESWWVIAASALLFGVEFFADKIPVFDLVWNVLQLFVRVPVAAVLTFAATNQLPFELQVAAAIGGGFVALVASGTKLAVRGVVTGSPEPVSNVVLSVTEDLVAVGVTWFAVTYPWLAASIVLAILIASAFIARAIFFAVGRLFRPRAHGNGQVGHRLGDEEAPRQPSEKLRALR
jgi:hypothetical protein